LSMVEADLDDTPIHFLGSPVRVTGYIRDELCTVVSEAGFEGTEMRHRPYAPATTSLPPGVQLFLFCRPGGRGTGGGEGGRPAGRAGPGPAGPRAPRVPARRHGAHRR